MNLLIAIALLNSLGGFYKINSNLQLYFAYR